MGSGEDWTRQGFERCQMSTIRHPWVKLCSITHGRSRKWWSVSLGLNNLV